MTLLSIGATKPRKYRNRPTTVDGITFDSKAEARRYSELKLLEKAGEISDLSLQPQYPLTVQMPAGLFEPASATIGKYVADFRYYEGDYGDLVVEDVKGTETALFKWKRKHFEAEYGIKLRVIK